MMVKRSVISLLVLVLAGAGLSARTVPGEGAFLDRLQKRDSVLVGDQLMYGFDLHEVPEGTVFGVPDLTKALPQDIVPVVPWLCDTLSTKKIKASNSKLYTIRQGMVIAPFTDGTYTLPPLAVTMLRPGAKDADTIVFEPLALDVCTMPVDTATFVPHDIKGQARYPLTLPEALRILSIFWAAVLLVAAIVATIITLRRRAKGEDSRPAEPAHIRALRKIDAFRSPKYWEPPRQKAFYSGVTDALREYIAARFGVGAMEMTTAEIFDALRGAEDLPSDLRDSLKDLFERADFVKFAKMTASAEENAAVIPEAVKFVTSTYLAPTEETDTQEEVQ